MNAKRSRWLAAGMLLTSMVCLASGAAALCGIAGAPGGDLSVSSTSGAANLALALGAATLLGLDYARTITRRPHRPEGPRPASETVEP